MIEKIVFNQYFIYILSCLGIYDNHNSCHRVRVRVRVRVDKCNFHAYSIKIQPKSEM